MLITSSFTTRAAERRAASVFSESPTRQTKARLPGASSGQITGASLFKASRASTTPSRGSYSTEMSSIASSASRALFATIIAMQSPTYRTRPTASPGRGGFAIGEPSACLIEGRRGSPEKPAFNQSSPVKTAITPGAACAMDVSIARMFACACGERTNAASSMPGSSMSSR